MASLFQIFVRKLDPMKYCYIILHFLSLMQLVNGQYRLAPQNTVGVEGQSALMTCAVNSVTGVVVWNHIVSGKPTLQLSVGGKIDLTVGLDKSQRITVVGNRGRGEYHLRINNVRMSDAGRYECMALVGFTRLVKRSAALKVVRPPKPGYPVCNTDPPAFNLKPGMEIVLSCETMGGIPTARVRWHDGRKALTPNTEGQVSYTHTLIADDYGKKFICHEITPAYKTPRTCEVTPLEIDLKVDLQPSPRTQVRPGGSVTFSCYGQGTNVFDYTWELNDQPLPLSRNIRVFGPKGQKLTIGGITAASNNAKVACVLTNSHGFTARTSSVITVMPSNKPRPTARVPNQRPSYVPKTHPEFDPRSNWPMGDYDVHYESEIGGDWGMDSPYGGENSTMSSSAMTAMAAALVGLLVGVFVAVGFILARKYLKRGDGSIATLINRTQSTSIPCSSVLGDHGSGSSAGPPAEYDLPPRDYPRGLHGDNDNSMSYLGLRPESMTSTQSTYQGLNPPRPRLSTYNPSGYYSSEYEVGNYNMEYYEDVLNQENRESIYHYRFSPPIDESEIHPRCMSADRSTRHFMTR